MIHFYLIFLLLIMLLTDVSTTILLMNTAHLLLFGFRVYKKLITSLQGMKK